jgi:threonine/homoserine/homoserine lactone efflux protein
MSLTAANITALFSMMIIGALIPSVSALTVSARSAALGFQHGVFTSAGIVVGDIVFILVAIFGLNLLSHFLGEHFYIIHYLGGTYLIWLGLSLWQAKALYEKPGSNVSKSYGASFMTGLLVTLGDQKAILFYLGFFPAFMDLSAISLFDTGVILLIAIIGVGGPKLAYALLAARGGRLLKNKHFALTLNRLAGLVLLTVGLVLIYTA